MHGSPLPSAHPLCRSYWEEKEGKTGRLLGEERECVSRELGLGEGWALSPLGAANGGQTPSHHP